MSLESFIKAVAKDSSRFIRTCQECGFKQTDTEPIEELSEAYIFRKCKRCKSESLDYGSRQYDKNEDD